nr:FAD-binding and (Fe-S)-binding domain-containing protein [Kibdelosporangium sp. MJ126-NF4]CEL17598.1 Glycolate dehydrogenase, subunit GlcD [Kibdelosporangium sp. MJ126-NF4]CTQ91175.1 Glycolate dehydrogenase (EC 1.1.99.14), subunit GlcD [Kibdelosporangium sp. MJ126-NF4]
MSTHILPRVNVEALESALLSRVDGEVRFDPGSRGAYATDGSNYRQVPIGVVIPRSVEAAVTAIEVCREHDAPVLSRGGGTSLAGECTNVAVVVDWTKYCNRIVSVDAQRRTCVVEPGIVLDDLNRQLSPHGLEFGPRPSTHSHCSIGGMIGNNSCGATAQRTGKTVDNIQRLEILTYQGTRCWVGATSDDQRREIIESSGPIATLYTGLESLRDRYADLIRERFPDIPRRVSGYNLDSLLPEQDFHVARLLVGSEGTLATVLHAELDLVAVVEHTAMVVLGYPDIAAAADAVPAILKADEPVQLEALDDRLVQFMSEQNMHVESTRMLPAGGGWLLVQFGGQDIDEATDRARRVLSALGKGEDDEDVLLTSSAEDQQTLLKARESGLGATSRARGIHDCWPGWEDAAVPPERLGDYLRDLRRLFHRFDLDTPSLYGHFGQGCVHVRIPFRLDTASGVRAFRAFVEHAADLVVSYGGSLSGEHGDGQARGELLVRMFGPEVVRAFGELKSLFDPDNRMNPGKVVAPNALDENLRLGADWRPDTQDTHFQYPEDDHSFNRAVLRCVGVGQCRRPQPDNGVMCPSYQVTREEKHSTRGRARLLFEMLRGHHDSPIGDGWRSTAVRDALDLCLACKGCKSDCPVGVDMATYKAEFLAHHYQGRIRPMAHYALGWLPLLARIASRVPRTTNAILQAPGIAQVGKRLAGVTQEREAPPFASETFQAWWQRTHHNPPPDERTAVIWPDTFSNYFHPHIGQAAVSILESAGFRVAVPTEPVCCGLTWISTGQLLTAKRVLSRTAGTLRPWIDAGSLIVGLEPSCTAVLRADAAELMPDNLDLRGIRDRFVTLAEALLHHAPGEWRPRRLNRTAIAQKHCHHHAIMGFQTDMQVLRRAGINVRVLDSGCCGLAGNFGFERGHYDVSMACAEQQLLPAVRQAAPETLVLADGFSCRTQIGHGDTGRRAMHLAEALLLGDRDPMADEQTAAPRPKPERAASWALTSLAAVATVATTALAATKIIHRLRNGR